MSNKSKITIIGGGINGLCSAYYLSNAGYQIEIIDPSFSKDGTSYGNAGMIVPSHFVPMASPGIISKGMKWMFSATSPFYIKPRINWDLFQWLLRFQQSATTKHVTNTQKLILDYNELSKREYRKIAEQEGFDFDYHEAGLLMLYKSDKGRKEEEVMAKQAHELGVEAITLSPSEVQELNPSTTTDVLGGVYYPGDAHIYSNRFMVDMKQKLANSGATFTNGKVVELEIDMDRVSGLKLSDGAMLETEEVVIAAGTWTAEILKKIGVRILLQDGKGYSMTQRKIDLKPSIPSILTEEKVAITPMGSDLRITGTLEVSGKSTRINYKRVRAFLDAVPRYFPDVKTEGMNDVWTGYRPLSYDGVPYLGRSEKYENLVVATGHGMMGMSLGPATGKIVSQIISGEEPALPLELMSVNR